MKRVPRTSHVWRCVRLGNHASKIGSGVTPTGGQASYHESGIPLIRSQNVHMNRFEREGLACISEEQDAEMAASRVAQGDVLLNITGASIGRVCVVPNDITPANVNQHVTIIRSDGSWVPQFLSYYLSSPAFQKIIFDGQAGATRQALTKATIEDFVIPLPPLMEQERIAAELTTAMAAVNKARRSSRERFAAAEALPAAYLRGVFEGPGASGWETCFLGDLVDRPIRTGISKPTCLESDTHCLTLSAVRGRTLRLDACKPVAVSESEATGNWVQPGRFYVVRGNGNRTLVGRGAFAPDPMPTRVLFPDLLFQLALDAERLDPGFFGWLWSSPAIRREIEARAKTAAGIYKINTGNLNSLPLPVPPIIEQRRISVALAARVEGAEHLVRAARGEFDGINALPAALLRQAFRGNG